MRLALPFIPAIFFFACITLKLSAKTNPLILRQSETLHYATLVNDYFMRTYPDVGAKSYVGGKERNSKIWTRGVYYEGLMAMYRQYQNEKWLKYTEDWGNFHKWTASADNAKRHADFQCCGQAFLDMYMLDSKETIRKAHIKGLIDEMMATNVINDWYWIDAIQMAMPIFAQLGKIEADERYFERMYEMYMYARNKHGGSKKGGGLPLFNVNDGLWYRDYNYDPPYMDLKETDKPCYWSRGNGWVYVALARVLYYAPDTVVHREQYIDDFIQMSEALIKCQREDGFWGVSLAAPTNTGHSQSPGAETSGTALFIAGMAYGVTSGILEADTYLPGIIKGWNAMCETAVHENGFLGYVQGTGAAPEDGQPVMFGSVPNFEDYGIGCFLLAAAEVYQLGDIDLNNPTSVDESTGSVQISFDCAVSGNTLLVGVGLPHEDAVILDIIDIRGCVIKQIKDRVSAGAVHHFRITTDGMSGYYFCRLKTSSGVEVRKIIVQ